MHTEEIQALNARFKKRYGKENYATQLVEAAFQVKRFLSDPGYIVPGGNTLNALNILENAPEELQEDLLADVTDIRISQENYSHMDDEHLKMALARIPADTPDESFELQKQIEMQNVARLSRFVALRCQAVGDWAELRGIVEQKYRYDTNGCEPISDIDKQYAYERLDLQTSENYKISILIDQVQAMVNLTANGLDVINRAKSADIKNYLRHFNRFTEMLIAENLASEHDRRMLFERGYVRQGEKSADIEKEFKRFLLDAGGAPAQANEALRLFKTGVKKQLKNFYPEGVISRPGKE